MYSCVGEGSASPFLRISSALNTSLKLETVLLDKLNFKIEGCFLYTARTELERPSVPLRNRFAG